MMKACLARAFTRFTLVVSCLVCVGVSISNLFMPNAAAVAQGDGTIIYGEGTVTTPRSRTWAQATTSWSAESSAPAAAATIRHVVTKASPKRDEMISGVQATTGTLYVQLWNGSSWSNQWNVAAGNGNLPRFDIAYERNSGDALVVYSANVASTNELRYRRWNGTSWSAATNLDTVRTSGIVQGIRLESHAGTLNDDLGLAWIDANLDISANYWVGSSNSWGSEPAAALSTSASVVSTSAAVTTFCFDVAFESSSGEMVVAWGNNAVQDLLYITRAPGSGGAWGTATTVAAAAEEPTDLELSSDPNSDYIAYANITDNTAGAEASSWTGSAWNTFNNFDTSTGTVATSTKSISLSWVRSGTQDRAVVSYEDAATSAGVDWLFYNKNTNTWSAVQTDFTTAPAPATDVKVSRQVTNPFNPAQLMLVMVDSASDVFAKRLTFDGTSFVWSSSEPGAAALELTISSIAGMSADFAYAHFVPGPLAIDIVDAAGSPVASPSLSMTTANVSLECQPVSGIFGTTSQKLRINNGTSTPGWTLSLAATSGNTANWSSGSSQYDFNDSSGSPGGCGDGGDADAYAGQLSIDPSTGGWVAKSGCSTTGLTVGGASAFSQGTLDSVTIATASTNADIGCYWDLTSVGIAQDLPAETPAGNYTINVTLTITAN